MAEPKPFDRTTLEQAFERLGEMALHAGKVIDLSVYGGSALVLTTNFRIATQDVDAVFEADRTLVRKLAKFIADEFGWPEDWLNDGVKGFLSANDGQRESKILFRSYPSEAEPGLRVFVASSSYLFAMKCLAMRIGGIEQNQDVEDIRRLGAALNIRNSEEALGIVMRYYPAQHLSAKTRLGLEEIFGGSTST